MSLTRDEALAWGRGDTRRIPVTDFPAEVLELVTERQRGCYCAACKRAGLRTPESEPIELDHRQPLARGGDNHHLNLEWACRGHNRAKGSRRKAPAPPPWARKAPRGPAR